MVESTLGVSSRPFSPQFSPSPWLMFSHGKSSIIQTFYNVVENRSFMRNFSDLCDSEIEASCDGWVVVREYMEDNTTVCFLLNFVSMEKILLPTIRRDITLKDCVLSSSPLKPTTCMVVCVSEDVYNKFHIMLWRPGQNNWVERKIKELTCLTYCDEKVYGFDDKTRLVVVDIVGNNLHVTRLKTKRPKLMNVGTMVSIICLVESCGEIFMVNQHGVTERRVRAIEVFKLEDKNKMNNWVKVIDLGDRVFFINNFKNGFSCSATNTGLQKNTIYFTSLADKDTNIYWYNLTEDRLYGTLPCPNVVYKIRSKCWLMI